MTIDFSHRSELSELMDSDDSDFATFRSCLVDLAKVNELTLAYRPTLQFFDRLAKSGRLPRNRPINVVDVGSGFGDMLRKVDHWAVGHGLQFELTGVDRNPWSAKAAASVTETDCPIHFCTTDIFDFRPPTRTDIVISSLFTHHLDDETLIRFVRWMEANAAIGWFINDLHRHPIPYHFFRTVSRALRFHEFVQHDGPISIARAFTRPDWEAIVAAAGVPASEVEIRWMFPFRLCVSRCRAA
jgi:SAM-dependent methyltransferase